MWKRAGKMQRAEITLVRQHLAHALGRPGFDIGADPAQPLDLGARCRRHCRSSRRAASRAPDRRRACRSHRSCGARNRRPAPTAPRAAWCDRARCARPCCRCVREKPGSTKPVLRPDAAQATRSASSTATDQPRRATSRATVKPGKPARRSRRHRRRDRNSGAGAPGLPPGSPRTSPPPYSRLRSSLHLFTSLRRGQRRGRAC